MLCDPVTLGGPGEQGGILEGAGGSVVGAEGVCRCVAVQAKDPRVEGGFWAGLRGGG